MNEIQQFAEDLKRRELEARQARRNIITIKRGTETMRIDAGKLNQYTPHGWKSERQIAKAARNRATRGTPRYLN